MQTKTESTYLIHHLIPSKNLEMLFGAKYNVSVFVTMNVEICAPFIDVFQKKVCSCKFLFRHILHNNILEISLKVTRHKERTKLT